MTYREKAIVMAYTGKIMLPANKLNIFFDYIEEKLGRSIYNDELGFNEFLKDEVQDAAKEDFMNLWVEDGKQSYHELGVVDLPYIKHEGISCTNCKYKKVNFFDPPCNICQDNDHYEKINEG